MTAAVYSHDSPVAVVLAEADAVFQRRAVARADVASFLAARGFSVAELAPFGVGYADQEAWGELERRFSDVELIDAGLFADRNGRKYPRFRDRLTFPVRDAGGALVGYTARTIANAEPKYLNSPASPTFEKGKLLYGLDTAKPFAKERDRFVLVEGVFDVIRLRLAGVKTVVAPLGTSVTEAHADLMAKTSKVCYLAFDSDTPGQKATARAGLTLAAAGIAVRVVTIPDGHDPDSAVQTLGAAALFTWLNGAVDLFDWHIEQLRRANGFSDIARTRASIEVILPLIRATASSVARDLYITRLAELVRVSRSVIDNVVNVAALVTAKPARSSKRFGKVVDAKLVAPPSPDIAPASARPSPPWQSIPRKAAL